MQPPVFQSAAETFHIINLFWKIGIKKTDGQTTFSFLQKSISESLQKLSSQIFRFGHDAAHVTAHVSVHHHLHIKSLLSVISLVHAGPPPYL
jgi:hypothetical protein